MIFSNASLSCRSLDGNAIKHNRFLIAILFCYSTCTSVGFLFYFFSWLMVVDLNCPSAGQNDTLNGSKKEVFDLLLDTLFTIPCCFPY